MKAKLLYSILLMLFFSVVVPQQKETLYKFNTSTLKYHKQTCRFAVKCTKNCIDLTLTEIKERKGTPCKICKPPKY